METTVALRPKAIENPVTLGQHIKKRRLELKILQKDVAQIIGVSEDTITYWENGRATPQNRYYPKIIDFLGYNPLMVDGTLGGRIKIYRLSNGLSQEELAKILEVDE